MSRSSPTTTRAVNEKRRPPLTAFATRLISTTRSCRSRQAWLTERSTTGVAVIARTSDRGRHGRWTSNGSMSYGQSSFAGALGEGLDATVELVAAAVEDGARDAGLPGALGEQLAGLAGLLHRRLVAQRRLGPADGGERVPGDV